MFWIRKPYQRFRIYRPYRSHQHQGVSWSMRVLSPATVYPYHSPSMSSIRGMRA